MTAISKLNSASFKVKQERVPVPSLGEDAEIIVRAMTIKDAVFHDAIVNAHAVDGVINLEIAVMAKLAAVMVDEDGEHIVEPTDVVNLASTLDKRTIDTLTEAYNRLNNDVEITEENVNEKKS